MRLRELVATELAASDVPVRLSFDDGMNAFRLQPGIVSALRTGLDALLFPTTVSAERMRDLSRSDELELVLGLEVKSGHRIRIRRGMGVETVRLELQVAGGNYEVRARGSGQVDAVLTGQLGLGARERFEALNLGEVGQEEAEEKTSDDDFAQWLEQTAGGRRHVEELGLVEADRPATPNDKDPLQQLPVRRRDGSRAEIDRLRSEYQRVQRAEALEERIAALQTELDNRLEAAVEAGPGQKLREVNEELAALDQGEVSDEDLALLRGADKRLADLAHRRKALQDRLVALREQSDTLDRLWRNPVFLPGTLLAALCTLISVVGGPALRAVALGNVVCLAGTLTGVLQFLRARDQSGDRGQRYLAAERALADAAEEQRTFERDLENARQKHGDVDVGELERSRARHAELQTIARRHAEERSRLYEERPTEQSGEGRRLKDELERARAEREQIGECPLASHQIAQELAELGIDASAGEGSALAPEPRRPARPAAATAIPEAANPLPAIVARAQTLGLASGSGIDAGLSQFWGRLLTALLGRAIKGPQVTKDGFVTLQAGQPRRFNQLEKRERILALDTLCLALLLRSVGRVAPSPWPAVLRFAPFRDLTRDDASRLEALYGRLASHVQIALFDTGVRADGWR